MTAVPPASFEAIYLRKATPNDGPPIRAMLGRCSEHTLRDRFLATTTTEIDELAGLVGDMRNVTAVELYIDEVSRTNNHATVLAWQADRVLAAGSILPAFFGAAEVVLVVEDSWQDLGLGILIAALLTEIAILAKLDYLCAHLDIRNTRARRLINRFCPEARFLAPEAGVVDVVIPVAAISAVTRDQHQVDPTGRWLR